MLRYMRNKIISIYRQDPETMAVHGILDDDIYSIEIDITVSVEELEILTIKGKWNRWTTPECPRAIEFLQEAVGYKIEPNLKEKVHKVVGRKSCRHFANLLMECCHSAKEAALVIKWEDAKKERPKLGFEDFLNKTTSTARPVASTQTAEPTKTPRPKARIYTPIKERKIIKTGLVIDLHVHTSPASPCSSAKVDDLINEAKQIGLDGICLTDHNFLWAPEQIADLRQKHGFLVLGANEITTDQGDVLVFGLPTDIKGIIKISDLQIEAAKHKAFMIAAHPIRGFLVFGADQIGLTPEKAMTRELFQSVDAIEVLNGKVTKDENDFALKVADTMGLPITGGSDAHEVVEVGKYATRFADLIQNEADLLNALKTGNYTPVYFRKDRGL